MLHNYVKDLFKSEKTVRRINRQVIDAYIEQLVRDDLELEEKELIWSYLDEVLDNAESKEEDNSSFWYKYGKYEGRIAGAILTVAAFIIAASLQNKK